MSLAKRFFMAAGAGLTAYFVVGTAITAADSATGANLQSKAIELEKTYVYSAPEDNLGPMEKAMKKRPGSSLNLFLLATLLPVGGFAYDRWLNPDRKNTPQIPKI